MGWNELQSNECYTLSSSGREAEPVVGSRREGQNQQATEAASEAALAADPRLRPGSGCRPSRPRQAAFRQALKEMARAPRMRRAVMGHARPSQQGLGREEAGEARWDVGQSRSQLLHFLKILENPGANL